MRSNSRKALALMLVSGGLATAAPIAAPPAFAECGADRIDCALKANANHPCCARKTKSTKNG